MDNWFFLRLILAAIGLSILIVAAIVAYLKHRNNKANYQAQLSAFLYSTTPDSALLTCAEWELRSILQRETENEWKQHGKEARKQSGGYRVDFERVVQQKKSAYEQLGVTPQSVVQYIHDNGGNPIRSDAQAIVRQALLILLNDVENNKSQKFTEDGMSPTAFFAFKASTNGDSVGVYIIFNQTKNMYYVGQAKRLCFRVNQHFTGHGNGDVYADYKYGDQFLIKLITLRESGYDDLDKLERDMIMQYHANIDGYNKTAGNYSS